MSDMIKVRYWNCGGYESTAYIDEITGRGEDKYSGIPLIVEWSEAVQCWNQIDTWGWAATAILAQLPATGTENN